MAGHRANPASSGARGRKSGDARNVVADGGAADGFFVVEGLAAERRVDHQIDFPCLDEVDDVGAALVHFENRFDLDACCVKAAAVPRVAKIFNPAATRSFATVADVPLVAIVYANENDALLRQALPGCKLRFGKRQAEGVTRCPSLRRSSASPGRESCRRREIC